MLMCGVGAKFVAHLMKYHLLQCEVVKVKFVKTPMLLIPYKFLTPLLKLFKLGKSTLTALSFFPEYNQSIIFFLLSL